MNLINRLASMALAACIPAGALLAQDTNANVPPPPENADGGGRRSPGNFDPAQFQQRMMENLRTKLAFTNDAEWASVQPLVQKVMEARRDTMAVAPRMGGHFGGGDRRPNARGESRGGPAFGQSSESEALQKALDGKGSAQDIKAALESYRAARKDKESKLASAQETLRKVLSVRQEAQAVLLGLLP